jgi:hypothetical protein
MALSSMRTATGVGGEGFLHQLCEVDRTEQACAVGRQGLLAAGVGGVDLFAVGEVVELVDAVDEDHARFGVGVGCPHDLVPQVAGAHRIEDGAVEHEIPRLVVPDRVHEGIGDQHREVEHAQAAGLALGLDEGVDVGVVAAQCRHHRAAAVAGRHDGAAHRVPHVHER